MNWCLNIMTMILGSRVGCLNMVFLALMGYI